jgi:hypothetical protein
VASPALRTLQWSLAVATTSCKQSAHKRVEELTSSAGVFTRDSGLSVSTVTARLVDCGADKQTRDCRLAALVVMGTQRPKRTPRKRQRQDHTAIHLHENRSSD